MKCRRFFKSSGGMRLKLKTVYLEPTGSRRGHSDWKKSVLALALSCPRNFRELLQAIDNRVEIGDAGIFSCREKLTIP
jgi:hypothetical protein